MIKKEPRTNLNLDGVAKHDLETSLALFREIRWPAKVSRFSVLSSSLPFQASQVFPGSNHTVRFTKKKENNQEELASFSIDQNDYQRDLDPNQAAPGSVGSLSYTSLSTRSSIVLSPETGETLRDG